MNIGLPPIQGSWPHFKLRHRAVLPDELFEEGGRRLLNRCDQGYSSNIAISFLTVVKNRRNTLERTISSVLRQYSHRVEHVIVDGNSTDGTLDLIRSHAKDIEYYVSREDRNLYQAINDGIELCRGRFICILNSDDWLTQGSISRVLKDIDAIQESENDPILCYGAWKYTPKTKKKLWQPQNPRLGDYFHCTDLCHNAMYIPRTAYRAVGPYDDTYQIAADSKWIMAAVEIPLYFITNPFPTCFYSTNGISSNGHAHWLECRRLLSERFPSLSAFEAESLLNRFYAFRKNIPSVSAPSVSDETLIDFSEKHHIRKFIDSALEPRPIKMHRMAKWSLKANKIIWRVKHAQKT